MEIRIEVDKYRPTPDDPFFGAWKEVVNMIGPAFFGPRTPEDAECVNHLRPIRDRLDPEFGYFSHSEKRFAIAAISYYNSFWAAELAQRAGLGDTVCDLLIYLGERHLRIIYLLSLHYRGW